MCWGGSFRGNVRQIGESSCLILDKPGSRWPTGLEKRRIKQSTLAAGSTLKYSCMDRVPVSLRDCVELGMETAQTISSEILLQKTPRNTWNTTKIAPHHPLLTTLVMIMAKIRKLRPWKSVKNLLVKNKFDIFNVKCIAFHNPFNYFL